MRTAGVHAAAQVERDGERRILGRPPSLPTLAVAGVVLELALLFGLVAPLSFRRYPDVVYSWTFASVFGTGPAGALRFAVPVLCAFAAFAAALWLAQRAAGRAVLTLVLGGSLIFSLTLLPLNPAASDDVYHNIADARTLWIYGDNPTVVPPSAFPTDPLYKYVSAWQDFPSVYGPLWYVVAGAPLPVAGHRLWPNVIGQKALTALFLFGTTSLAMLTAERIRPGAAAAAGVMVGWNPLLQFETAGNAHNDIVMICFALAALYAVTRGWWIAVFPLLALSVAAKVVLAVLGPVLVVWLLWRRRMSRSVVIWSLVLGILLVAALYAPFFAGAESARGFGRQAENMTYSLGALLRAVFRAQLHLEPAWSSAIVKLILVPPFLLVYMVLLWRIPREATVEVLARTCFWVVFLLLCLITWWFLPWYLVFLAPLGALLPGSRPALVAAVFSATAMLMYVPYFWLLEQHRVLLDAATTSTAFVLPVLLALVPYLPGKRRAEPMLAPAPHSLRR